MYLRWIVDLSPQREAEIRAQEIIRRNKEVRHQVVQLRRQLVELEKEAEKLGLMQDNNHDSAKNEEKNHNNLHSTPVLHKKPVLNQ